MDILSRVTVRALLVNADGKILVLRRSLDDEDVPGRVDFPGGGIEPGESYIEAIAREIEEESGLHVLDDGLRLAYSFTRYDEVSHSIVHRLLYTAHVTDETVQLSHEHDAFWWHTPDEVVRLFSDISWSEALRFTLEHHLLDK
jgi:8-oxo-dGTP pyrophosphatase MutT (NUDIX family)